MSAKSVRKRLKGYGLAGAFLAGALFTSTAWAEARVFSVFADRPNNKLFIDGSQFKQAMLSNESLYVEFDGRRIAVNQGASSDSHIEAVLPVSQADGDYQVFISRVLNTLNDGQALTYAHSTVPLIQQANYSLTLATPVAGPKGDTGPAGPKGATGSPGAIGPAGATGPAGSKGADSTVPGPAGAKGATGAAGPQGATGPQGVAGPTGPQGDKGDPGSAANAWDLSGNAGTAPRTNFLGTTDNTALEFKVNGARALRLEPNDISPNVIGGSPDNNATNGVHGATIAGGGWTGGVWFARPNVVGGDFGTVSGGHSNSATGKGSTIGGGANNTAAGDYSFVAGFAANNSDASHEGVFLFADLHGTRFDSIAANEFAVRASGGFRFYTSADLSTGCNLPSGSGVFSCTSDRNQKHDFSAVDGRAVLSKLAAMPITTWSYKTEDGHVRHMGPMAQDFRAAFALGTDDKTIGHIDEAGVSLAAIQGLYQMLKEKDAEIAAIKAELSQRDALLKTRLDRVEKKLERKHATQAVNYRALVE